MAVSKISTIIKVQKEKEVHKHQPKFNLEDYDTNIAKISLDIKKN